MWRDRGETGDGEFRVGRRKEEEDEKEGKEGNEEEDRKRATRWGESERNG
jgi:hypothetical protein